MSTSNSNSLTSSSSSSTDQALLNQTLVNEVPTDLKTLIRIVMRTFYGFELYLCMEMLLIYPCMKEDDLADLLRLDLKIVHNYLINLKKERFLNEKSCMETSSDGKQSKHSYFYINYRMVVNVIKYKLDKILKKIESDVKQFTTRALFKCTNCSKTYSDLDTKDIFLTMTCLYCGSEIDEDASSLPKQSTRNLLSNFNNQMKILHNLLSKVEHVRLADFILRPEPVDMTYILERMNPSQSQSNTDSKTSNSQSSNGLTGRSAMIKYDKWSGDKTRNIDLFNQTKITINFDSNNGTSQNQKEKKELPSILLLNRLPEEDLNNRDSQLLNSVKQAADETINNLNHHHFNHQHNNNHDKTLSDTTNLTNSSIINNNLLKSNISINNQQQTSLSSIQNQTGNLEMIIMQKLLKHEKKATQSSSESNDSNSTISTTTTTTSTTITVTTNSLNSSISITTPNKKRLINDLNGSSNGLNQNELNLNKKRKLNNGEFAGLDSNNSINSYKNGFNNCLRRNHSDGSENSDEYDDDYEYDSYYDVDGVEQSYSTANNNNNNNDDLNIPRVYVKNKPIRFDRVTPKLINLMNDFEKENYINICRQLYTEIYEI